MEGADGITFIGGPLEAETTEETTIIPAWRHPHSNSRISKIIYQYNVQLSNPHPYQRNVQQFNPHLGSKLHKTVDNKVFNDSNGFQIRDKGGNTVGHMECVDTTVMSVPPQLQDTKIKQLSTIDWGEIPTVIGEPDSLGVEHKT